MVDSDNYSRVWDFPKRTKRKKSPPRLLPKPDQPKVSYLQTLLFSPAVVSSSSSSSSVADVDPKTKQWDQPHGKSAAAFRASYYWAVTARYFYRGVSFHFFWLFCDLRYHPRSTTLILIVFCFYCRRCLAVVSRLATALAAPAMGFYLFSTCPNNDSFDAKRELKRVLRGWERHSTSKKCYL